MTFATTASVDAAIRTSHLGSIGLIGSSAKWVRFQAQLADAGHDAAAIAKITSPIGNPSLKGKEPAIIAVGVAAALVESLETAAVAEAAR